MMFWARNEQRAESAAKALAARVARAISPAALEHREGLFCVAYPRRHSYQVSLHLWTEGADLHLVAASDLVVERDWLPRELLLVLLEDQLSFPAGTYYLVPQGTARIVGLRRIVDTRTFPEAELKSLGESLAGRMQLVLTQLYARELILRRDDHETQARR